MDLFDPMISSRFWSAHFPRKMHFGFFVFLSPQYGVTSLPPALLNKFQID